MPIKIYSTSSCPYCKMAKEYLSSKGVSFEDVDVAGNQEATDEMVKISGQMGVPVIVIDGNSIVGFDKAKIDAAISAK